MIPIHPIVDHFTIALFTLVVIFEIGGWLFKKEGLMNAAAWNLPIAAVAAIISYLSGRFMAEPLPHPEAAHELMETHETLALIAMIVIVALTLWRFFIGKRLLEKLKIYYLLVGLVGLMILFATGFYGGKLVFKHGAGTQPIIEQLTTSPSGEATGQ